MLEGRHVDADHMKQPLIGAEGTFPSMEFSRTVTQTHAEDAVHHGDVASMENPRAGQVVDLASDPNLQKEAPVDIVLSYRTQSSDDPRGGLRLMWRVVEVLEKAGYTTFNGKQVPGGGDWREWWGAKARRCKVVVFLLSQVFFESKACLEELNFARTSGRHILPLLAEPYRNIPVGCEMILQGYNRIPSSGNFEGNFEVNANAVLRALKSHFHCLPQTQDQESHSANVLNNATKSVY